MKLNDQRSIWLGLLASLAAITIAATPAAAQKKPNVIMLMSDDVGWGDYGVYYGGSAILRRTSTALPRKARSLLAGMARQAVPRAVPRS